MKNENVLVSFINENVLLTAEELAFVVKQFELVNYSKGQVIKGFDEICNHTYFLLEGVVMQILMVNNKEIHEQFFFPSDFFSEYQSFYKQKPSNKVLSAKTNVTLYQISYHSLQLIYERIPHFQNLSRKLLEENLSLIMDLNSMLVNDSPADRYLRLKEMRPEVIQEIPQYMIATFLGMTAEALSRLKGRLARARFDNNGDKNNSNLPN